MTRDHPTRGEDHQDFLGEREWSPPTHLQDSLPDPGEARNDFWSISVDFICLHHVEPRVKLHMPREETFSIPLKYIDVSRATHTTLDDYWNIDGPKDLSDSRGGTVKLSGGDQGIRDHSERGEERRVDLRGESDGSQPTDTMTDDTAIH